MDCAIDNKFGILLATAYTALASTPNTAVIMSLSESLSTQLDKLFGIMGHEYDINSLIFVQDTILQSKYPNKLIFSVKYTVAAKSANTNEKIAPLKPVFFTCKTNTTDIQFTTDTITELIEYNLL